MTDFNSKKSRTSWVGGNIGGFFTSLLATTKNKKIRLGHRTIKTETTII